jgi:dihydroxyacetone synthase
MLYLAIALAGHLQLSNLVLLYDNNQVTCDGPLDWISTEDVNAKMVASGWEVINVSDGRYDVRAIVSALDLAKNSSSKPVFINIRTVIGVDMASAGTAKAHHGGFDEESIAASKKLAGLPPSSRYEIPEGPRQFLRESRAKGSSAEQAWDKSVREYTEKYPDEAVDFASRQHSSHSDFQKVLDK